MTGLVAAHRARYGMAPAMVARAPGRINLIGEHTDYNEGFVLPAAVDREATVVATPRADRRLRLHSLDLDPPADLGLDDLQPAGAWHDYPAGVAAMLLRAGYPVRGADLTLASTVPLGGGLSSSAALEVSTALALAAVGGFTVPPRDLALLCQRAEHEFPGVNCGIMDQFISVFGRRDSAILLDCRSLDARAVPLDAPDLVFAVTDSGVRHALAGGEYNRRRQECAEAVATLRAALPDIVSLRDVTPAQLAANAALFDGTPELATAYRRARHVVTENARVLATIAAIEAHDWHKVGELLYASHASLRDDYEVSVPELDALVELARGLADAGVLGARLMGGGFGGSTLTLLRREALPAFTTAVEADYAARTGHPATVRAVTLVDGASVAPFAADTSTDNS
ncbi:MAG TPA: galactokinase [Thermomicrobiales bacterium]|nr:galactokinase [Thermomicrobiales bacterium]